jgi:hypothetical protein
MNEHRVVYLLLRMRYWRLYDDPEVFGTFEKAALAFEDYTGHSWDEVEALSQEPGGDMDQMLGGSNAGSRILTVEIPSEATLRDAA